MSRKQCVESALPASHNANYVNVFEHRRRRQSNNRQNLMSDQERRAKFEQLIRRYEINKTFASKLGALDGYEIVFICDDSDSMNTELSDVSGPYEKAPTRWDELKQTVSIVIDLASIFDPDGVDVYFLNREPMYNKACYTYLFNKISIVKIISGPTPMVRVLRQVLKEKKNQIQERKLLIFLATDGVPTDDNGQPRIDELRQFLLEERKPINQISVTIIACTDDNECMSYLNNWDKIIPNLDVIDDYRSEKKEILACQGRSFPFSYGDYVVKILMGGIDPWFDALDEKQITTDEYGRSEPRMTTNNNF
ncbi:unnamed protein product [Rotaria sp. Silwood2]|nr:unnamed protein product [Rotaria sp. Silwood2]CAF4102262.1 unnamed protein product [Rotaria sp. Silwood2]